MVPSYYRIEISVKGDTCVLVGVIGLMQKKKWKWTQNNFSWHCLCNGLPIVEQNYLIKLWFVLIGNTWVLCASNCFVLANSFVLTCANLCKLWLFRCAKMLPSYILCTLMKYCLSLFFFKLMWWVTFNHGVII